MLGRAKPSRASAGRRARRNAPFAVDCPAVSFAHSSRVKLTPRAMGHFQGETLFDRIGRTICPICGRELKPDTLPGAADQVLATGCSITESIAKIGDASWNHGGFVSQTTHLATELRKDGLISNKERSALVRCAAWANIR